MQIDGIQGAFILSWVQVYLVHLSGYLYQVGVYFQVFIIVDIKLRGILIIKYFFWLSWSYFFLSWYFAHCFRFGVLSPLLPMAEGSCEKFPDHWDPEFFWTIIVDYISHRHPIDILVKRWVTVEIFPFFCFPFLFLLLSELFIHSFLFMFSGSFYPMNPESQF